MGVSVPTGLDLLLVNPASREQVYQSLGEELAAIEPPVWAGLMATFARLRGQSVEVLDAEAEGLNPQAVAEAVVERKPRLTAVVVYGHQPSASTQNMTAAGRTCRAIRARAPEAKTALVGGHAAALPERTLREEEVDFVCTGEGPWTLVELVEAIRGGTGAYGSVRGLLYRDGNGLVATPPAPLVGRLDEEMPGVAWDLLPMERYRAHNWHCLGGLPRQPYASLYTTLGCPYHCTFCCIQAPFKSGEQAMGLPPSANSYRRWSPEQVLADVDHLVAAYGVRNIKFADEMFVLHPSHVDAICDGLIVRRHDLNLWAYARVDTVRDGWPEKLRAAGFRWLAFGIEAASERVRGDVRKGFGQDAVFRTLERVRAAGINVIANYIFGLPEDDLDTMKATLDLALELNCEFANFYCAMAYPGSPLHATAVEQAWPLPENWSGYSQHAVDTLPLPTRHVPASTVLRFRDQAFQAYFGAPSYRDLVSRKFGSAAVDHLTEMASHKLRRRFAP